MRRDEERLGGWFWATLWLLALGWTAAHVLGLPGQVFNATRFILYDQGSYLYAIGRSLDGEALYRELAWQYGPLALGYFKAWATVAGNTPETLVWATAVPFAVAWVGLTGLVAKVGGKWLGLVFATLGLLPMMSPIGVLAMNAPHSALEMGLLVLAAWVVAAEGEAGGRAWRLGLVAGAVQWVRFGPHVVILAVGAALLWREQVAAGRARDWRGAWGVAWRLGAGYLVLAVPLAAWLWAKAGGVLAWEQLWPAHMVAHYEATYPERWPGLGGWRDVVLMWIPAATGLALAVWAWARRGGAGRGATAGLVFLPLVYGLMVPLLFRHPYVVTGQLWMTWAGLGLVPVLPWAKARVGCLLLTLPAVAAGVWGKVEDWRRERAWNAEPYALPNQDRLWFRPAEVARFAAWEKALEATPHRRAAVLLGGGGLRHFFRVERVGRHWWYLPGFVRPHEEARVVAELLEHEVVLVTDLGQEGAGTSREGGAALWIPLSPEATVTLLGRLDGLRPLPGVGDVLRIRAREVGKD